MVDQMSMPMTVNEVSVTGAKNIRRGFLDPILNPLLSDSQDPPYTVGEVLSRLQIATGKLSGLRKNNERSIILKQLLIETTRNLERTSTGLPVPIESSRCFDKSY